MALSAPLNINALGINNGFEVNWDAVIGAEKYWVYYRTNPMNDYFAPLEVIGSTSCQVTGLTNNMTCWIAVKALEAGNIEGALSTPDVTVTTGAPGFVLQPTNLIAAMKSESVRLTWNAPSTAVDGYKVFFTTSAEEPRDWTSGAAIVDGDAFVSGDFYPGNVNEVIITGLTNNGGLTGNTCYYFKICAVMGTLESETSEEVVAVPMSNLSEYVTGNIVKIPFHTGYNVIAIPVLPTNATTYGQLRSHLAVNGSISQMFYLDGTAMVNVATTSTKAIAPGGAVFVVTSSSRARYLIGHDWS